MNANTQRMLKYYSYNIYHFGTLYDKLDQRKHKHKQTLTRHKY